MKHVVRTFENMLYARLRKLYYHVLTKEHRDEHFGIYTHMIPRSIVIGIILTSMLLRGHWRSINFKKRSNLENTLRNVIMLPCLNKRT